MSNPALKRLQQQGFVKFTLENIANVDSSDNFDTVLENGTKLALWCNGIFMVEPALSSKEGDSVDQITEDQVSVLISCGVHGNETAPMEIVDSLVADILNEKIVVAARTLFILGNPVAASTQMRFLDLNLNRLFSGKHQQYGSQEANEVSRAAVIEANTQRFFSAASGARLHYDLHTAIRRSKHEKFAVYPLLHDRKWSTKQLGFLEDCGIEAILLSNQASGTYSYYTSTEFEAHSFTVELGSVHPFGENDLSKFSAINHELRSLLQGQDRVNSGPRNLKAYSVVEEIIKQSAELNFTFADEVKNFTPYSCGTLLVSDGEHSYRVTREEERIVFPHKDVPVGQRALLIVAPHTLEV